jgi:hypothetical protein
MDTNAFLASFLFGSVGLGMFMYGKRAGRMIPLGVGLALMVVPYFFSNVLVMSAVCSALIGGAWFVRES